MPKTDSVLELEFDTPKNAQVRFKPLGRNFRGRFEAARISRHDDGAAKLTRLWPEPVPGERICIDIEAGTCRVIEPLRLPEFQQLREKIEARGFAIGTDSPEMKDIHLPTFLWWAREAVTGCVAKIIKGTLPLTIEGEPQKSFITQREKDPVERLLERQNDLLEKLLNRLGK